MPPYYRFSFFKTPYHSLQEFSNFSRLSTGDKSILQNSNLDIKKGRKITIKDKTKKKKEIYLEDLKVIVFWILSPMLLMQKSRDKFNLSIHANDNDTKRDKLKLCLRMLMLQGNFSLGICSESYNFYQKILFSKNLFFSLLYKKE